MQPTTLAAYLKLGAAAAIVGAVAAGAISFTMPRRYVSTAVMRFTPQAVPAGTAWQIEYMANRNLGGNLQNILSRSSLTEMIQRIGLDLYREGPWEDGIQDMRSRDLRIERLPPRDFRISLEYPDRLKAEAVVRELTARFNGPAEILSPASLPETPTRPDRLAIVAIGLGVGLVLGLLFAFLRRRGLTWTLRMAGGAVAGSVFAVVVWLLMPNAFADDRKAFQFLALGVFTGLVAGAFLLRARGTGGNHYARMIAFSAAFGAIAGGFVSFAIPERYVSTATMRAGWTRDGGIVTEEGAAEYNERLRLAGEEILCRASLTELIQRPSLDLYRSERFRRPMEDIVNDMRRRVRIGPVSEEGLGLTHFQISFEYADRDKAQAVVREVVDRYRGAFAWAEREFAKAQDGAGRKPDSDLNSGIPQLEVLDLASPASPVSPNRPAVVAIGLLAGLLVGGLLALRRWLAAHRAASPGPHVPYGKYLLVAAAIGAIAFGLGSFVIPDRYVSTAVLRVVPFPAGGVRTAQGEIEHTARLRQLTQDVLSRGSLTELVQRPSLDLYRKERQRYPAADVITDMRNRDIRIAPTPPFGFAGPGRLTSFEISFEYPDRFKAAAVVRQLVTKFIEGDVVAERALHRDRMPGSLALEVLDPPSDPQTPVYPNRPAAAAVGLLAGLLVGGLLALRRWLAARRAATPGPHVPFGKYTLMAAAMGAIAFGLGSYVIPDRYVSTAVLRVVPFPAGGARTAQGQIEYTARLRQLTQDVLSRGSLTELIERPSLDLYRKERQRYPLADVINDMRNRDIRIAPTPPFGFAGPGRLTSFEISFEYPDRFKAAAVVRELVTKFIEGNVRAERDLHRDKTPGSLALEVLDPPSDPQTPVSPNRPAAAAIGLLAGMLLGPFLAWRRQRRANRQAAVLGPRPSYWKYALPAAILGAISAAFASFYIPNRYVSTAVLRLVSADPRSPDSVQAAAEHMPEMFRPVLSRDSLAEIIQRPTLQLYTQERSRRSLDEVVKQMRERDLHVEPLRDSPFGGRPTAFRISFEYTDRAKASESVQAVVSKFVEAVPLKHGDGLAPSAGPGHLHVSANGLPVGPAAELFANPYFPERDAADLLDNRIVEGGGDGQPTPGAPYLEVLDLSVYGVPVNFSMSEFPVNFSIWGSLGGLAGCPQRDAANLLDNKIVEGGGDGQPTQGAPYLEVLDLPSVSEVPVSFARGGALGGLGGLLLGIAIARARRPAPHSGPV